jgi:hypothetical protein
MVQVTMSARAPEIFDFSVRGPIARGDLPGLCERVCAQLEHARCAVARFDVAEVEPDAVTVDALVRLKLAAQRHGCRVHLRNGSPELFELVGFMGLADVLPECKGAQPMSFRSADGQDDVDVSSNRR